MPGGVRDLPVLWEVWQRKLLLLEPAFVRRSDEPNVLQQWLGQNEDPLSEANIVTGIDPAVLVSMRKEEAKLPKMRSVSASIPRWYHDARVSVMMPAQLRQKFQVLFRNSDKEMNAAECLKAVTFVADVIRSTVAGMLFIDLSAVKRSATVAELGIDSLLAAEFRNWLHSAFGKNISMLDLMDVRTNINALAEKIVNEASMS
ncbi:hypothetical protein OCU04_012454 [Sclerotinia nivalis]|uniref:Carrier domain-containing protein n=1 Tax=Sclerotinia nivalis TaxID=352851 RepID=A0A9X0A8M2_9HELO|nr:hypothetical protein OCU04_012454 [Sclerotinia nivalis]